MFLSMLVAWMIPDVPRSLREQLKKENMMLMEFLLNQDQEQRAKSYSPRRSIPHFPASIDIVVEAPPEEEEEQQQVQEEEEEEAGVEINLDEPRPNSDGDPEDGKSFVEVEENGDEKRGCEGEDEATEEERGEKEKEVNEEVNEEDGKGDNEQEEGEEKEEEGEEKEEERQIKDEKNYVEEKADEEEKFTVDLDSFMSDLGLLGRRGKLFLTTAIALLSFCQF